MKKTDFNTDFDNAFKSKKMNDFEDWFCDMAEHVWGTDFEKIKAGGQHGDKKSDGRLISCERVYQCYAPESPSKFASDAPDKVDNSFPEVITYWPKLNEWVFVHNNTGGITTTLSDRLENLRNIHTGIKISEGSRNYLKNELHDKLTLQQLIDLYPNSIILKFAKVEMEHIRPLLRNIAKNATADPDPSHFGMIPDEDKLDFNKLSPFARHELKAALAQAKLVDKFLQTTNTPGENSVIQTEISDKYEELKGIGYSPDEILKKLLKFIGNDGTPTIRAAAYVIVAYYFDSCDVFENKPTTNP